MTPFFPTPSSRRRRYDEVRVEVRIGREAALPHRTEPPTAADARVIRHLSGVFEPKNLEASG